MIIFRDKNNPKGNLGKNKTNSTNSSPEVLPLKSGDYVKNAKNTGNDTPSEGDSWIDYWEKHTGKKLPSVCPLCGKPFKENDQVDGCHVQVKGTDGRYRSKKYIIPGHHECNCQRSEEFPLSTDVDVVEAE